jgi:hypothetical protein
MGMDGQWPRVVQRRDHVRPNSSVTRQEDDMAAVLTLESPTTPAHASAGELHDSLIPPLYTLAAADLCIQVPLAAAAWWPAKLGQAGPSSSGAGLFVVSAFASWPGLGCLHLLLDPGVARHCLVRHCERLGHQSREKQSPGIQLMPCRPT